MSHIAKYLEAGRPYFESRADREIEKNRKGDIIIHVVKDGKPVQASVSYELEKLDFDIGCNIFMLGQYDDPAKEKTYLSQWLNVFNTAVIPFYWEGTEPEQGRLRYSANVPNDIYRRPPIDRVVQFCEENNVAMKGHPLFWHEFIPKWLPENWNDLLPLLEKRMQEISSRYADKVPVFDVVNEPARIWDMTHEHKSDGYKMLAPPDGYIEQVFEMAQKYFPTNELILNEAVGGALCEFKGSYGGYYQLIEKLLGKGIKIDRIGLQCHTGDAPAFQNVFHAERFYGVLDGYSRLGRPLVLSEISVSVEDEEVQAQAAELLYKSCFSHENVNGIFWWNLDDNGILTTKNRDAIGENLPYGGLVRDGRPKAAYKVLDNLVNKEWRTTGKALTQNGKVSFRGFYGRYTVTIECEGTEKTISLDLHKGGQLEQFIDLSL